MRHQHCKFIFFDCLFLPVQVSLTSREKYLRTVRCLQCQYQSTYFIGNDFDLEDEKTLFSQLKSSFKSMLGRTYFGRKYVRGSVTSQGGSSKLSSTGSVKKQEGDKDIEKEYLRADIMEAEADADEDEIDLDGNF